MPLKQVDLTKYQSVHLWADSRAEERDLVIIGGGVAGYVAAIKAGQEGLKVCPQIPFLRGPQSYKRNRSPASRNEARLVEHA